MVISTNSGIAETIAFIVDDGELQNLLFIVKKIRCVKIAMKWGTRDTCSICSIASKVSTKIVLVGYFRPF